ncbi:MAG: hypothetical protein WC187_08565 [Bacillota bacterium]
MTPVYFKRAVACPKGQIRHPVDIGWFKCYPMVSMIRREQANISSIIVLGGIF